MHRPIVGPSLPPGVRPPGIGEALGMIVLYFVLQLAVSGLLGLLMGALTGIGRRGRSAAVVGAQLRELFAQPDANALLVILTLLITAGVMLWLLRRRWPVLWSHAQPPGFGLTRSGRPLFYAAAVVCGLALPIIGSWLTQWLAHGHEVTQDIKQLGGATSLALRIPLVLVVISAGPLVEELLFRGLLLSALLQRMPVRWAVAASSLLFACMHLPELGWLWYAVPSLALLAAVLAWLRLYTGSLWPAVVAHGVNNLLAVVAWFVVLNPPT